MRKPASLLLLALLLGEPAAAAGQEPPRGLGLSLLSGGAAFSAFRKETVRATRPEEGESRVFERAVAAETSTALSVAAHHWWEQWGIRVGATLAPSGFVHRLEERDRVFLHGEDERRRSEPLADVDVWLLEGALLARLPTVLGRLLPFAILGGGAVLYRPEPRAGSPLPSGVRRELAADATTARAAGVLGLGGRVILRPGRLALAFELTDHLTTAPFGGSRPGQEEVDGIVLEVDPGDTPSAAGTVRVINHVRFVAGVSFALGGSASDQ